MKRTDIVKNPSESVEAAIPRVRCPHCRGLGTVELTGVYADTLALLGEQATELNGANLARLAGIPETAMNNRLVRLEELGLAVGRRYGRQRLWKVTHKGTGAKHQ